MIRVLQVVEATEGGVRRHLRDLLLNLPPEHYRCVLAVAVGRDATFQEDLTHYRALGIVTHTLKMRRAIAPLSDLTALIKLLTIIRRERIDLIHAHSSKAGFLARVAATLTGKPIVYTPHCFAFLNDVGRVRRYVYRVLERLVVPLTTILLVLSREEEAAARSLGYQARQVMRLRNGIAAPETTLPTSSAAESLTVGFFGRLTPQKGADILLKAAAEVVKHLPNVRFRLHGSGPAERKLRTLAAALDLGSHVEFDGAYSAADVLALMREMTVVVVPSRWEGAPYVVLEAWCAAVPLLATAVGGVPEMVVHGESGLCVPAGSAEGLADALLLLLRTPSLRERLAHGGRTRLAAYTIAGMVGEVCDAYTAASAGQIE